MKKILVCLALLAVSGLCFAQNARVLDGEWSNNDYLFFIDGFEYILQCKNDGKWENQEMGTFKFNASRTRITFTITHLWNGNGEYWEEDTGEDAPYTWDSVILISGSSFTFVNYQDRADYVFNRVVIRTVPVD